ncbi:MAG: hypothetical protein DBP02_01980 [gamma proteobacterium symbiont of Ctena orbiculata]|nr:MAG: hypothetical protein DBP02_01980 [gamma proteobacterium symbiont of Ctena orbiculata]
MSRHVLKSLKGAEVGVILVLTGLGLAIYGGLSGKGLVFVVVPILCSSIGGILTQASDGKLYNLYYRESKGLTVHANGVKYLLKIFIYSLVVWGAVSIVLFAIAKLFS